MWLPPDHPDAPHYWTHETGGELRPAVLQYLEGNPLNVRQVQIMKQYLWQWVASPVWQGHDDLDGLRLRVTRIQTQRDVSECIDAAIELNMDPL
jgi:hypothetical protein